MDILAGRVLIVQIFCPRGMCRIMHAGSLEYVVCLWCWNCFLTVNCPSCLSCKDHVQISRGNHFNRLQRECGIKLTLNETLGEQYSLSEKWWRLCTPAVYDIWHPPESVDRSQEARTSPSRHALTGLFLALDGILCPFVSIRFLPWSTQHIPNWGLLKMYTVLHGSTNWQILMFQNSFPSSWSAISLGYLSGVWATKIYAEMFQNNDEDWWGSVLTHLMVWFRNSFMTVTTTVRHRIEVHALCTRFYYFAKFVNASTGLP